MRLLLKSFQEDAVETVLRHVRKAARDVRDSADDLQAIGLSSPTGSGKTVIATAVIERIIVGDPEYEPDREAVFLWITDQPQLNEQTRRKMLRDSSVLSDAQLITLGSDFDQEEFTPGTVNFLNIQKLGKEKELITRSDEREFTIWETISNTTKRKPRSFFVVIDEAHRGMVESPRTRAEANTIVQKFIKGSPGEIPPVPLIVGISATIDRYNTMVSGSGRTVRSVDIPIEDVRASGLLKEVVTLYYPETKEEADVTLLREAVTTFKQVREEWQQYCDAQGEPLVRPILVVQVEDATGRKVSKTDIEEALEAIEAVLGTIPSDCIAHAFHSHAGTLLKIGGRELRYVAPADVQQDEDLEVVFFKTSLNTGWDCPRAEVMMSFRRAVDATTIAQLVGRMVRAPLARRIESVESLNSVSLYLPHYDRRALKSVIERLKAPDPASMPPVDIRRGRDQTTVRKAPASEDAFAVLEELPSYVVPLLRRPNQVRRLMKLARALAQDEIEVDADEKALAELVEVLASEHARIKDSDSYSALVEQRAKLTVRAVDWQVGSEAVDDSELITIDVASANIDDLFERAGRRIGDEGLHKTWWKRRRGEGVDHTTAKLELVALSIDPELRRRLEDFARRSVQERLRTFRNAIAPLAESRRAVYQEVRGLAHDPELRARAYFPDETATAVAETKWDRHVYVDEEGVYPADLTTWEALVLEHELAKGDIEWWFRNVPRKPWALGIPHEREGRIRPFYPDIVVLRRDGDDLRPSLLDPHTIDLSDAPAKAVGLAKYAAKHSDAFERIELIIVRGRNRNELCRIDLVDEANRARILRVTTKAHLEDLFEAT